MSLTVTELAEEVRESNRRLTQAVEGLGRKFDDVRVEVANLRVEMAREIGAVNSNLASFRTEVAKEFTGVAKELGAINSNLESFKGRVETSLGVAKWSVNIMTPVVISLFAFAVRGAWYLAKLDSRLDLLIRMTSYKEVRTNGSGSNESPPSPVLPHPAPDVQKSVPVPK